jgi:hypothetical protein
LRKLSDEVLYFLVLDLEQLIHLLDFELQNLDGLFELFDCLILLGYHVLDLLIVGSALDMTYIILKDSSFSLSMLD